MTETIKMESSKLEIVWRLNAVVNGRTLTLRGRKYRVNGEVPTSSEKQALLIFRLSLDRLQAKGVFEETNYKNETLQGMINIIFSEKSTSFRGSVFQEGKVIGTLLGKRE